MWNAGLDESQAGIKIAGKNVNSLRYADDTTLMAESEEELKSLLMGVKKEYEKAGLNLKVKKPKISSWKIQEEKVETVADVIFLVSKITVLGDYSHKIKGCLLLGRKAMIKLDSILKSRDITLPAKVHIVKTVVFLGCGSWTIKNAEHQRIDSFKLWYWRRLLRVPWTIKQSNQSMW